jgi:hypothetical protein
LNYAKICLGAFLLQKDFQQFDETADFCGFFDYSGNANTNTNNLYMFFDISRVSFVINDAFSDNTVWLTLIDEIVNHRRLSNNVILNTVSDLFLQNDAFCFLLDESGDSYEIPIVKYVSKRANLLNFTYVFGEPAGDQDSIFGPYYYFTDYENAIQDARNIPPKTSTEDTTKDIFSFKLEIPGGIVRFAIFTGIMKYVENHLLSEIERNQLRIEDDSLESELEEIADYDGLWREHYDSVYICKFVSNYGKMNLLAVKDYDQQVPLSYHYTKKTADPELQ